MLLITAVQLLCRQYTDNSGVLVFVAIVLVDSGMAPS